MSDAHAVVRDQLRSFIERIERLEEEKKSIADDIKDVYGEAKGVGFDTKILREVIKIRKQDKDERAEREAILDSYLAALGMIEQPGFFDDEPTQAKPIDRKARAALRTSEAMDDNKAFSAELVAAGLISEEAHAENIALSNAVARKYGAGVIDPETGEILDEPRRSDLGLNIQAKHEDIRTAPETADEISRPAALAVSGGEPSIPSPDAGGEKMDGGCTPPGRSDDQSAFCNAKSGQATNTNSEKATVATQGEATAPTSDERVSLPVDDRSDAAANAGGDDVDGGAERATHLVTGEGAANTALPDNTVREDWPLMPMKRLHYAHCFPELTKAEYGRLEFSIIGIGVSKPIIRMGDVIVDGWARYTICRTLGISYPIKNYSGNDALLDVIEWQRASRNFTPAQEKKIAADLAKEIPHRADDIFAAFGLAEALEAAE